MQDKTLAAKRAQHIREKLGDTPHLLYVLTTTLLLCKEHKDKDHKDKDHRLDFILWEINSVLNGTKKKEDRAHAAAAAIRLKELRQFLDDDAVLAGVLGHLNILVSNPNAVTLQNFGNYISERIHR